MQDRHSCCPPSFSLAPQFPPTFIILESPLSDSTLTKRACDSTRDSSNMTRPHHCCARVVYCKVDFFLIKDGLLLGQVFATFATFFYSFQQLLKYSKYLCFNVLSCFQEFYIATFCNFFDFCVQLFTAIFIKYCAKCKSVNKKNATKLFQFSSILFDCMKKSYMTE